jgi:YD repeat-containing protein
MIVSEAKTDDIACFSSDIQQKIPASAKIVEILCEPDVRNETIFNIVKELYIHGFRDIHIYIHLSHFHFSSELAVDVVHPTNRAPRVVEYAYDHLGRMVCKTIGGTNGPLDTALAYVWDDYNIVRESRNGEYTYNVWGLDLNGTLQGCGGVGGLLAVAKSGEVYTPTYDANGNISEYVDSSGTIIAHQEYDPFGNAVVSSGNVDSFTHWFSTKPWCGVTGMVEYQLRKLNTEIGSFLSRDHIDNNQVYGFSRNVGFNGFDFFGTFWGK